MTTLLEVKRCALVDPYESNLQADGSVVPAVTPDPPLPPGQDEVHVPDIMPVSTPDGPDRTVEDARDVEEGEHLEPGEVGSVDSS